MRSKLNVKITNEKTGISLQTNLKHRMNYNTALRLITAIDCNLDGGMRYSYDLSDINKYKLTMIDNNGEKRHLTFKLQKEIKRRVYVNFICDDFRIDFPRIKDVERFKFNINDFTKMLYHGVNPDKVLPNGNLDVEF
jgi:hypothetical protein